MFHWKRAAIATIAVGALVAGLAACASETDSSTDSSTLTLGMLGPATTFAAADASWANETPYLQAVYDTVLRAEPDGTIIPGLATAWSYNDDNTTLTLTLRDDVTFTDGTAMTADIVGQNLLRFRDGTSPNSSRLAAVQKVSAVTDTTLEVTLSAPDPALLGYLAQNAGLVESPSAFDSADIQTEPVGSGPYILDEAKTVVGSSYVFSKNPDYWDPESVHYDNLVLNVYADPTSLLNAIKGGQVNASQTIDDNTLPEIEAAGFTLTALELDWTGLILFDRAGEQTPALADVSVRQALNYAFDKESLLKTVGQGRGTVTSQVFPENSSGFVPELDDAYPYDPAKARELLAEAGYPDGLTISMPTTAALGSSLWTLIDQQLKDVGVTVQSTDAGNNFIADLLSAKYSASWMRLQQDPDWALINFQLTPDAAWNPFHYDDPTADALIATVRTASGDDYDAAVQAVNEYVVDQAWFAPWYRPESTFVTDANTSVELQTGNSYPSLWNIRPKE
ncbi:ABC transporter substrate-binding protein [Agreia sp. PsM10]|uniref:ABC transporter substrate-binding protein n=1 Tax=Agreia sp. PsM10 TaxID=3030533 RepID=UPI00263AB031|nr:ABC transporter substrate-binding protein [Agreia sp. PsM10]MDN4640163.1 ABC transporter substrate-binding protein [Agreia sp. PsM10]